MRKLSVVAIIILSIAGAIFALLGYKKLCGLQNKTFQTAQPTRKQILYKKVFVGNLIPAKEIRVNTHITGVVEQLFVQEGDYVQQGAAIARIAIQPDPEKVAGAKNVLQLAAIKRNKVRNKFLRNRLLFRKKMLAKEKYEESLAEWETAQEELTAAKKKLQIIQQGYAKTEGANIIKATTEGTILSLPAREGSMVEEGKHRGEGSLIALIGDIANFLFSAKVAEIDVVHLKQGMSFEVSVNALKEEKLHVTLAKIAPKASEEEAKRGEIVFTVEGLVTQPKNKKILLRAGYVARAEVVLAQVDNVVAVPEKVIQREGESDFVHCLEGGKVIKKKIKVGLSDGLYAEVKEGLTEMDQLITEPIA